MTFKSLLFARLINNEMHYLLKINKQRLLYFYFEVIGLCKINKMHFVSGNILMKNNNSNKPKINYSVEVKDAS